jgi:hypothetical protein
MAIVMDIVFFPSAVLRNLLALGDGLARETDK